MKKKILVSSILTIVLCFSLIVGSTFALFTSSDTLDVSVTSGTVDLTAKYYTTSMKTWSLYETEKDARTDGKFANSGTAVFTNDGDSVVIERMTPGDVAKFKIKVKNDSNVNIQYRVRMISEKVNGMDDLTPALAISAYIDGALYPVTGTENESVWRYLDAKVPIEDIWVTVSFPNHDYDGSYDNQYQNCAAKMTFVIEAVQGTANQFSVSTTEDNLLEGNDSKAYLANKIHNGEGATIPVTGNVENSGFDTFGLAGQVTLSNVTINGADKAAGPGYALIWDTDDGIDSTLILADNAKLIGGKGRDIDGDGTPDGEDVIRVTTDEIGESFTLIMDKSSHITVSGAYGHAVFVQNGGAVINLVLNGSLKELFTLTDGAEKLFGFAGGDGEKVIVNFYVNSVADMNEYKQSIEGWDYVTNWFVNGVPADGNVNNVATGFFNPNIAFDSNK
jgi:predicted ribosomally synthesized peptide with SipW-like signal peptide